MSAKETSTSRLLDPNYSPLTYLSTTEWDEEDGSSSLLQTSSQGSDEGNSVSGHKTIGNLGSIAIAVNALAGPAILQLPFTFQQAGVIPTSVALLIVGLLSALCCMHTANIVSKVPGNRNFDKVVEFSDPFRLFWSKKAYFGTQIIFYLCTLCVNIAAIIDTAQVVDSFVGHSFGTWGYGFDNDAPGVQEWKHLNPCSRKHVKLGKCIPFDPEKYGYIIITLGYLITAAVFLPICLMDLKENTAWQIFGFMVLLTISVQFVVCFLQYGLTFHNVSLWGETWDSMLGVILFNFGLVMAIPAWLAEKKETVSVGKVVYGSTALSVLLYIGVGLLGALAIPNVNANMLAPMTTGAYGPYLQVGASVFAFFIIGLDIPLFSVLTRYNLVNSGLCSVRTANILVVYLPWGFGWLFYQGSAISELLSWGGILFTGALAFLLPLYLAVRVLVSEHKEKGSLDVYFGWFQSRAAEITATKSLLALAIICFVVAVVGQVHYDEQKQAVLDLPSYVNDVTHNQGLDTDQIVRSP